MRDCAGYAKQNSVQLTLNQSIENGGVYGDKNRLAQVMNNLISNAAKFSPPGETVTISVAKNQNKIRISVSDHGPGIPIEFQPKLYEKFTQYDASDTRKAGGTGLGLAITRAIVEKHGGTINFVTSEGSGTTFYFDLPELYSDPGENISAPSTLLDKLTQRILIVEDDLDVATLLRRMLVEAGLNCDLALDAQQAMSLIEKNTQAYAAITLDIALPGKNGIDFLSHLRANEHTANIPVIVVSVTADDTKRCLQGGSLNVLDWINKPIDQQRLRHAIAIATANEKKPHVLHIEDDADTRRIVDMLLKDTCQIAQAPTVQEARRLLDTRTFDLVLIDLGMPDGSGLDVLDKIDTLIPRPRVILFTAQEIENTLAKEVQAILIKSRTSTQELLNSILGAIKEV